MNKKILNDDVSIDEILLVLEKKIRRYARLHSAFKRELEGDGLGSELIPSMREREYVPKSSVSSPKCSGLKGGLIPADVREEQSKEKSLKAREEKISIRDFKARVLEKYPDSDLARLVSGEPDFFGF